MWTKTNTEEELIKGILIHGPEVLDHCLSSDDLTKYVERINNERLLYPKSPVEINPSNWFIPELYKSMDIKSWLLDQCDSQEEQDRVAMELDLYNHHSMIPVLNAMKYIVDTLRANNIVWGVGRGSSVASYVLYLIGVHKVDSIKYNLPIEEFFKGEQNG
jgi:DNA polymerase III alpha subunit